MSLGQPARCLSCLIVILLWTVTHSFAQTASNRTSIGFADPSDTRGLLEYRLPDWGYRTWDLGFNLSGSGSDRTTGDDRQVSNNFSSRLDTDFRFYRESERRTQDLNVAAGGDYQRSHLGNTQNESSGHALGGRLGIAGYWHEYLNDGPFILGAAAGVNQSYDERIVEYRNEGGTNEERNFGRRGTYKLSASIGWGRIRDVTPLIRAQRLSERLTALGRPRLTRAQIQEVAQVLAREQGYRTVFDRPERSFWDDVLAPMLAADRPLSTYEVFYLRDVLSEDIGSRQEGVSLLASYEYASRREDRDIVYQNNDRNSLLGFIWVRNLSLNHQLALRLGGGYRTRKFSQDYPPQDDLSWRDNYLLGNLSIEHLWILADRYHLGTLLRLSGRYQEAERDDQRAIRRDLATALGSSFRMFVEDNMSVVASIRGSNAHAYQEFTRDTLQDEDYRRSWSWSYSLGLEYYLDRFLY